MNKRQHKKVMCTLVGKLIAQANYPELKLKSSKVERKLFRNQQDQVRTLVKMTLNELNSSSIAETEGSN